MLLAFRWIQRSRRALGIVALAGIATCGAAQQPASTAQPGTSDRAKAYLHYSLGHLYYERGVMGSNQSLLNQAIDEFQSCRRSSRQW